MSIGRGGFQTRPVLFNVNCDGKSLYNPIFSHHLWARTGFGAKMDRRPGSLGLRIGQPSLQKT